MSSRGTFDSFVPRAYLRDHYSALTRDTQFMLRFFNEAYRTIAKKDLRILEVGGGATLYQLMSAAPHAREIIFTDMLSENLSEVERWKACDKKAFSWKRYFDYVARYTGIHPTTLESRLRVALKRITVLDVLAPGKVWRREQKKFDVVSSHFCPESITSDRKEFLRAFGNVVSFVKPRGALVMSFLKEATNYHAGTHSFPAYPIKEDDIRQILKKKGFHFIEIQSIDITERKDHNALMCVLALR